MVSSALANDIRTLAIIVYRLSAFISHQYRDINENSEMLELAQSLARRIFSKIMVTYFRHHQTFIIIDTHDNIRHDARSFRDRQAIIHIPSAHIMSTEAWPASAMKMMYVRPLPRGKHFASRRPYSCSCRATALRQLLEHTVSLVEMTSRQFIEASTMSLSELLSTGIMAHGDSDTCFAATKAYQAW